MHKIAILYICTGEYSRFFKRFRKTCKNKFLTNSQKTFFVFTDNEKILKLHKSDVYPIFQDFEEWPFATLHRFSYFFKIREELLKYDYIFFMNANLIIRKKIFENEILPVGNEKLVVTLHPGFFNKDKTEFPYDRNPESCAYIPYGEGNHYFAGGFNGGKSVDFLNLCEVLKNRIENDYSKNIIAIWHDESHLNKYMYEFKYDYKILSPAYLYPEGWKIPFEEKIRILDKKKLGGHKKLRRIK